MMEQARNLLMDLDDRGQRPRFLIHDHDRTFSPTFDATFESEGVTIIRTPIQAPNANAHAERWVGSARRECLDRILILGHRQLERLFRVYVRHHNERRPHRALEKPRFCAAAGPGAAGRCNEQCFRSWCDGKT
jgi:transposase InsO family protein